MKTIVISYNKYHKPVRDIGVMCTNLAIVWGPHIVGNNIWEIYHDNISIVGRDNKPSVTVCKNEIKHAMQTQHLSITHLQHDQLKPFS